MNPWLYFGFSIILGVITSSACALKKLVSADMDAAENYPNQDSVDNKITKKRLAWLFTWLMQGAIGGFVVAFVFAGKVFRLEMEPDWVWAIAFLSGSVSWLDFKKSLGAIKEIFKLGK